MYYMNAMLVVVGVTSLLMGIGLGLLLNWWEGKEEGSEDE